MHKPGTGRDYRGVGIRDSIGQAAGADQFHRHEADDATSAARYTIEFHDSVGGGRCRQTGPSLRRWWSGLREPATGAALYADHQAVDAIAAAAPLLTHFEHR